MASSERGQVVEAQQKAVITEANGRVVERDQQKNGH